MEHNFNPADKVTVDIPLFIRLLEYAREDAKTDMDLHKVTENIIALSETGKTLTMAQYDAIVNGQETPEEPNRMQELAGIK
jgi:phosphopantetheine adenylyltransferase